MSPKRNGVECISLSITFSLVECEDIASLWLLLIVRSWPVVLHALLT